VFNVPGGKPAFCKTCKTADMINVKARKCVVCKQKQPVFNMPSIRPATHCKECAFEGMVDILSKKCQVCHTKRPIFNNPGETQATHCGDCKSDNMVDVKNLKCEICRKKVPCFNMPGSSRGTHCNTCKLEGMIDVRSVKCATCGINRPIYNFPGVKTSNVCTDCKLPGMVNVATRRCVKCTNTVPCYNFPGRKRPTHCSKCKTDDMVDVVNRVCPGCDAGGAVGGVFSTPKYDYHCATCFLRLFPGDPRCNQLRIKTKEEAVKQFINERFTGFHHDRPLEYGGCDCSHRRRVDHRKLINGTLLCVETDEFQHRGYDNIDEEHRYNDIAMVYGGKMVFIRYNPDPYRDEHGRRTDPPIELRFPLLERCMRQQIKRIEGGENKELLEVVHLFYDGSPNVSV